MLKKGLLIGIGVVLSLVVLGTASFALAQANSQPEPTPQPDEYEGWFGPGMMWQQLPSAGMMQVWKNNVGNMHGMMWKRGAFGPGQLWGRQFIERVFMGSLFSEGGFFGNLHDYMLNAITEALGLPADELQTRLENGETIAEIIDAQGLSVEQFQQNLEAAITRALDKAVADGALTQEQADWMKERSMYAPRMWMRFGNMGSFNQQILHEYMLPALAEAFGLSVADLEKRHDAGETMWEIAESQGMTLETFRTKMTEAHSDAVNKALAAGKLTQAQADRMIENFQNLWEDGPLGPWGSCGIAGGRSAGRMMRAWCLQNP